MINMPSGCIMEATEKLVPFAKNPKIHTDKDIDLIVRSVNRNGWGDPILVCPETMEVLSGNGRLLAAKKMGLEQVPIVYAPNGLTEKQKADLVIASNKLVDVSGYNENLDDLIAEFDLKLEDFGMDDSDLTAGGASSDVSKNVGNLAETFLVAPISTLNSREGKWQERKRAWVKTLGMDLGATRENKLGFSSLLTSAYGKIGMANVSIFDCVLAELMYKWFTPTSGEVKAFDPFAGDTCKGGVFAYLGADFTGIELRQEQVEQNRKDLAGKPWESRCKYIQDSGENCAQHFAPESQDFMFSCPPYFDLEKYSDDPQDASNQSDYEGFRVILEKAFLGAAQALKKNRFAVVVMSNVRNHGNGGYYDICGDICRIMEKGGMVLYNEFILINSVGTGGIRARGNMKSRKNVRCHQEVLVFYKGDDPVKDVPTEFGDIRFADITEEEVESA